MKHRRILAAAILLGLGGCVGNPQRLPVGLSLCNAVAGSRGFTVTANVQNKSDRPISNLGFALSFYHDYRYTNYTAQTHLRAELDPGQRRDVTFAIANQGPQPSGQAIRCQVTHIGYLDGSSQDIPPPQ